jgi:UDP-glucose 4-epimerase
MNDRNVLVTGASGFLGANLVSRLLDAGNEVHAVARRPSAADPRGVRWHAVDLGDAEATERLVRASAPGRIFHLASRVTGRRDLELVLPTFRDNLAATVHLLAAASAAGVERIVLAGSMEETPPGEPPGSPYAAAKSAASLYARFFHALYQLPVVIARIFMVYGPGQRDPTKVVPASIRAALAGERPRISSGARPVDWIYVDDVAKGLVALGAAPDVEGRTLDLGSGELVTVRAVVERICELVGGEGPDVGALPDRALEHVVRADPETTRAATGWSPRTSLDEGLAQTIDWLRAGAPDA